MNQILELREKRAKAWDAAKAFLDSKRGADGMLSAEDAATYDRMEADIVNLGKEVERLERLEDMNASMKRPTAAPLTEKPMNRREAAKTGRASEEYNIAFWNAMRNKVVNAGDSNTLKIGEDDQGGYLVPDEFMRILVEKLEEQNLFRRLAHVIRTSTGDRKIPVVATKGTASWIEEEALYPESGVTFDQVSISAYKLATMIKISEELLNDSVFDMPSYIAKEFARRIGNAEEQAFFTGDGSGKPTGIITDANTPVGVTAASATALTFDEVVDLFYALPIPYRNNAVFMMHDSTVKALRKLKNGQGEYIWQPSITAGAPDTILHRPVYTSQYMPEIAAGNKAMLFGDMSYYWVADRESRSFKRLNELYAPTGQVGFLGSERVDGKLILPEAVRLLQMKTA